MKVLVEVRFEDDGFESEILHRVFMQVVQKAMRQSYRLPGCVCTAPEADDVLRDDLGRIIGKVEVTNE